MKKLGKLKLTQLSRSELSEKQMNLLKGGDCSCLCGCSCSFECSCTPYPEGGMSNSMSVSRNSSDMVTDNNTMMTSGANAHIPAVYQG